MVDKGKFIHESSPESKASRTIGIGLFILFVVGGFVFLFGIFMYPCPPDKPIITYISPYIISAFLSFLSAFLIASNFFGLKYRAYENGVTLPVYFFYNLLTGRKDREGRFVPYKLILGYNRGLDDPVKDAKDPDKDVIAVYYWNPEKKGIRMAIYGQNAEDVNVMEESFRRNGVMRVLKTCPNCGNKLLGMDYLAGKCKKCGSEIFDFSEIGR